MIFLGEWDARGASFVDLAGRSHRLTLADLVELAAEGRDAASGQRLPGFAKRFAAPIIAFEPCDQGWHCRLDDGGSFVLRGAELAEHCAPPLWQVPRAAWCATDAARLPVHDFADVIVDDEALRQCLLAVARFGFARLTRAAAQPGEVERLAARFTVLRETNYGRVYDVIARPSPANLADSAMRLLPHTDNPYRFTPPDLQLLHAIAAADSGGETELVDGFAVCEALRAQAPEAFALLAALPVRFAWSDDATRLTASAPVIQCGVDGAFIRLRCNDRSRQAIVSDNPEEREAWRSANAMLMALIADAAFTFRLAPGDMLILDNRRVMHGRAAFVRGGAERHLQGGYADADGLYSRLFRLTDAAAGQRLDKLADLFGGAAMAEPYGEDLSIRDHMLQCAELAVERRLGNAMVSAALLHDIGWALHEGHGADEHQHLAADFLAPLFGPEIAGLVRRHVAAKRYLVATTPDYEARLSDESRRTLARQGGPMVAEECADFAAQPGAEAALQLRYLDDAGKELQPPALCFANYASLLRSQLTRHLLGQ